MAKIFIALLKLIALTDHFPADGAVGLVSAVWFQPTLINTSSMFSCVLILDYSMMALSDSAEKHES